MIVRTEPDAKSLLARAGVAVPRGVTVAVGGDLTDVAALHAPLVCKAFGPGIVHKSDVGAVRLGISQGDVSAAIDAMTTTLAAHGLVPAGFLVEEQCPPGVELLVGATRTPYGITVAVGLGGTFTELFDDVAMRLAPLTPDDADALLDGFRAASMLRGGRGAPPVDRGALVRLLLAIAGDGGVLDEIGPSLSELDCNPVIARPDGATVVDARLVVDAAGGDDHRPAPAPLDADALFAPRTIAVAGASTTRPGFGNRAIAAYRAFGWTDGLAVIHPNATEVDGVPAYHSVGAVPGGVDYLLAAVPAASCPDLVRDAAGRARVVHVISGGFREAGVAGAALEQELCAAAREARVRVLGPNCIGVYAPSGRQTFQLDVPTDAGDVSIVSQSGGLAGDIVRVGAALGLRFAKVCSVGNCIDVSPAEIVDHYLADRATRIVGCYLEGGPDGVRLVDTLRAARGVKPVIVMTGGSSEQGRAAAMSHTGALTSSRRVWDAIRAATGVVVVERLEDFLGVLVFARRFVDHPGNGDPEVLVVGVGGGASVLAADACDRAGLRVVAVYPEIVERLRDMGYGAGTSVANPIEIGVGPSAPTDVFETVLDAVLPDQPVPDVLLHVNVQAYYGYGTGGIQPLSDLIESVGKAFTAADGAPRYPASRVALVARNLDVAPGADADAVRSSARAAGVPTYRTFDEAAVAIAAGKAFAAHRRTLTASP